MQTEGSIRRVDELGCLALPAEIRRIFNIKEKDPVKIYMNENEYNVILKKKMDLLECMMTGKISLQNRLYSGGRVLSSEGAEKLYK
ncbi:AbrB/MazE/SpoVT family DNA-binding domain-containing protein [Priestia megaterium]|uniref:AbrB/MazE/SpoVT family DNA-binding domain-containing protein n=1 Tax=Priestia megaterium TaxID=1404 RepID=UPI00272FDE15|nr:AbrB/MazE/SpoVT family DNA-binding domain-containing protein [Priestia megaterium]MDP1471779.1 AbrB/MazE/SpoVT family DNA-binding domain-containing protein [Priestia megaterium]